MKRPLLLLPLLALLAAGCATPSFRVHDAADRPVEGALVFWTEYWGTGCCPGGNLFYIFSGPVRFKRRAMFTDETGLAKLPHKESIRATCSSPIILTPDCARYHIVKKGETILPAVESFESVDMSAFFDNRYPPKDRCMRDFDAAVDGISPSMYFTDPVEQARFAELLFRWRQLRAAAKNASATPSPAEETHAENAKTSEPEPHAESAAGAE